MNKYLTFIIMFIISFQNVLAQKTSEIDSVLFNAENWFKDVYVENYFNDPYSYRLVAIKAIPITNQDFFNNELTAIQYDLDTCTLSANDKSQDTLKKLDDLILEADDEINKINNDINSSTRDNSKEILRKRLDIQKKYYLAILNIKHRLDKYHLAVKSKKEVEYILENMSDDQASKLRYYDIRLDCYSKNKIGNEVLGRFSFPFTKDGLFEGKIEAVKHLNK